jgi:hypothetical protein
VQVSAGGLDGGVAEDVLEDVQRDAGSPGRSVGGLASRDGPMDEAGRHPSVAWREYVNAVANRGQALSRCVEATRDGVPVALWEGR